VQELCNGGSLRKAVQKGVFSAQHPAHWQRATLTLLHISAAMAYVHANRVMHGCLNPSHVFFKVCTPLHIPNALRRLCSAMAYLCTIFRPSIHAFLRL
jgi:hypothetical protein